MKLLCIVPAIDLKGTTGLVPGYWQLFKGLYETGNNVIVTTYTNYGRSVESLWWKIYSPAVKWEASLIRTSRKFRKIKKNRDFKKDSSKLKYDISSYGTFKLRFIQKTLGSKFKKHILKILKNEKDIDVVVLMSLPINHFVGLPSVIKKKFGIPVLFFDFDLPVSLPMYFWPEANIEKNWYLGSDLSAYDAICGNSLGALKYLHKMGAEKVFPIYYGADPSFFSILHIAKDIDIIFYGHGTSLRKEWMDMMIKIPSRKLSNFIFAVEGFESYGNARPLGHITISNLRDFCSRSKIALNIPRKWHAEVYASSHARLFELTSLGCCTICRPIKGLHEWFKVGKEVLVVHNEEEACEVYQELLFDADKRMKIGQRARERVLKEHTFKHRANQLTSIINTLI